jgi:sterol 3beta-glucosyltransferase
MKFVVVTYGTEGDARPLSALCRALVDAGHEARLLADAATLGTAESLGISTVVLAGDIRGTLQSSGSISPVVKQGSNFNGTVNASCFARRGGTRQVRIDRSPSHES